MSDKSQKTEKPTRRRLDKAREDGQFAVSREFLGSLQFVGFLALLIAQAPRLLQTTVEVLRFSVAEAFRPQATVSSLHGAVLALAAQVGAPLAWAGAGVVVLTLLFQLMQTRFGFSAKRLQPDLKKFDPFKKAQQTLKENWPQCLKALVLLPFFCWIVYTMARQELELYLQLPFMALRHGLEATGDSVRTLLWRAAGLFLVLGVIDFARSHFRYQKDLRMSRQEIRDEMKEVEGHPMIKARMRRLQREMLRKQMLREVPTATAVVVNPTHFAVAIRYEPQTMAAPKVVASGLDFLALRIRKVAREHEIPVIENPPLAQALYRNTRVGQEIPEHLYRAVAEVLAYVFQLRQQRRF
ncbi:MAG: EscU/YscU/HrcU family type III secretion system export apparatus switch protein [Bryobacterales bacterium]|jgi:flagellar biosynthetic protein FlhB|nr:EscU/YscU/HrcU family type III secretion system export apparatus switch protein [Bryobacterales bacterium]